MYVENLKDDFYEFLAGKRVLLMVHYDIDSICTCKIVQTLFRFKNILYSLSIIRGIDDLKQSYQENCDNVQYFLLINCGGCVDLIELLEPTDEKIFFILDAHRPTDLHNIYSDGQIRLLSSLDDDHHVPEFHDIFRDDSDEDGSDNENDDANGSGSDNEGRATKRRRLDEQEINKRRERRLWDEKRYKLLFEYSQFSYYAKSSAVVMFNLAWQLNKDDNELLWLAIIGITEQLLLNKIESNQYILEYSNLQAHINRLKIRTNDSNVLTTIKLNFINDLKLILYKYWTIEDSIKYTPYTACKMKLWSHRGNKKLQELLADMGFPLVQSRQAFQSMDLELRKEFQPTLEKISEKYDLNDIVFNSFHIQYGYRDKYCASDIVYILLAILESSSREKTPQECFNIALDCLNRTKAWVIQSSINKVKIIVRTLFKTVQAAIDMKQVITAGPFVYYIIQEGGNDWYLFSHQNILLLFAHFIQKAFVSMSRNRKAPNLPMIVSAPKNQELNTCIILGIPPLSENSPKNFFGKAFEQAAERIKCDASYDYFDTSYFEIYVKDRPRFLDALTTLLT